MSPVRSRPWPLFDLLNRERRWHREWQIHESSIARITTARWWRRNCAKLRELRDDRGWSIDDFRNKLAEYGVTKGGELIPATTAYSYEQGKQNNGANLPVDLYPVIAAIYGYKTPFGWLPSEFPDLEDSTHGE